MIFKKVKKCVETQLSEKKNIKLKLNFELGQGRVIELMCCWN